MVNKHPRFETNHELVKAMTVARVAHHGQTYAGESYFAAHLSKVAAEVRRLGGDDKAVQVAWLHDTIEDTRVTAEFLATMFEKAVVDAVVAMTHLKGEAYEDYVARVKQNETATLVKVADIRCNLAAGGKPGDTEERTAARQLKYRNALVTLTGRAA